MTERALSHKPNQVPVYEEEIEACGVSHEYRSAIKCLGPTNISTHRQRGFLQVRPARCPSFWLASPPFGSFRVGDSSLESFEIRGKCGDERLVSGVRRRTEAQH